MKHKGYTPGTWHSTLVESPSTENGNTEWYRVGGDITAEQPAGMHAGGHVSVGRVICDVRGRGPRFNDPFTCDAEANARLIADAPRLAERVEKLEAALRAVIAWTEDVPTDINDDTIIGNARAVLAEGK